MDSKENVNCLEKKNRIRGENWTQEEKDMFLQIMDQSAIIIENKLTDTNSNKRKNLEWVRIQKKLKELSGISRDIPQLKGLWRRLKLSAKKSASQYKRALQTTGGGQKPPSPPPSDLKIMDLCPTDFVIEENIFDSDAITPFESQDNEIPIDEVHIHNSTIYDIEEVNEVVGNESMVSFVDEVVTVADVHSNEMRKENNYIKIEAGKPKIEKQKLQKLTKKKDTTKGAIVETNIQMKQQAIALMKEEHDLKMAYQKQEIAHQQLHHKLEIDILLLEKEKKKLEIELINKKLKMYMIFYLQNLYKNLHNLKMSINKKLRAYKVHMSEVKLLWRTNL